MFNIYINLKSFWSDQNLVFEENFLYCFLVSSYVSFIFLYFIEYLSFVFWRKKVKCWPIKSISSIILVLRKTSLAASNNFHCTFLVYRSFRRCLVQWWIKILLPIRRKIIPSSSQVFIWWNGAKPPKTDFLFIFENKCVSEKNCDLVGICSCENVTAIVTRELCLFLWLVT